MVTKRLSRPEQAARTRQALLDTAENHFLAKGYHAASLQAIADDAGFTKGAIFAAFDSKAGLFLALCDQVFQRRLEQIQALFELVPTTEARLAALASVPSDPRNERWLLSAIEFCAQSAGNSGVLTEFAARYRRMHDGLAELASQDPGPLGARQWAIVTLALTNGLTLERLIDPDGVPPDLMANTLALVHRPE